MTWELFARGRWSILAAWLGAIAFPGLILAVLNATGPLDASHPKMLMMHVMIVQIGMFIVASAVFTAQGPLAKLYAYPARTSTLVFWRMAPAMATVAIVAASVTAAINVLFRLHWPLWPTALFLAVAVAAVQAAMWLAEKSLWIIVAITVVATVLGLWLKSRYGPMFGDPERIWTEVTPVEALTMLLAATGSYGIAVYGVARNRRGEPPFSLGVVEWITQLLDRPPARAGAFSSPARAQVWFPWRAADFSSPARAQVWFQWQVGGWIMPACVFFGMLTGLVVWLLCSRDADDLVYCLVASGGLLTVVGLIGGLMAGNMVNTLSGDNFSMGSFVATRPMTNDALARAALHVAIRSVLVSWTIWVVAFAAALAVLALAGELPNELVPPELGWRYFPLTILGAWLGVAPLMTICLTGRLKLFFELLWPGPAVYVALDLASKLLNKPAQRLLDQSVAATVGLALILGTTWLYALARRRGMIHTSTVIAAACLWAAASATLILNWPLDSPAPLPIYLLLTGVLALAVAPFAAAPLAIAWNRHR
jgi:hypothetical protein